MSVRLLGTRACCAAHASLPCYHARHRVRPGLWGGWYAAPVSAPGLHRACRTAAHHHPFPHSSMSPHPSHQLQRKYHDAVQERRLPSLPACHACRQQRAGEWLAKNPEPSRRSWHAWRGMQAAVQVRRRGAAWTACLLFWNSRIFLVHARCLYHARTVFVGVASVDQQQRVPGVPCRACFLPTSCSGSSSGRRCETHGMCASTPYS